MCRFIPVILAVAATAAFSLSGQHPRLEPASAVPLAATALHLPKPAQALKPQQAAPRDTKAPMPGTAVIRGRVIAAVTGDPLRRARLQLAATELDKPRFATTDAQGRFEFTGLPSGRYTLTAGKTSYVTLQYGQRRAFEAGRPIELADKQVLDAIEFALPRAGVITGRITDDTGEPVAAASVSAMRPRYAEGRRQLVRIGRAIETDDRGEYRLFDLAPGSYYVGTSSSMTSSARGDALPFGTAYHPGTANPDEAQRVSVKTGEVRAGADVLLQPVVLSKLSGVVVNAARGAPLSEGSVRAYSAGGGVSVAAAVRPDGTFAIAGVPPGDYSLVATGRDPDLAADLFGFLPVTVTGGDVGGLFIQLTTGGRATGQIVFEGAATPPVSPSAINLFSDPVTRIGFGAGRVATIKGDWTFELTGQLGPRLVSVSRLPAGWALKAVVLDGRDVTDTPITFTGTEEIAGIRVVLTNQTTKVSGRVTDDHGRDVSDCTVVVFAEDRARWTWRSRFIATARPDLNGRFAVTALPPASYFIVALEYLEEGDASDPEYLEVLGAQAAKITIDEGESKTIELKLVRNAG